MGSLPITGIIGSDTTPEGKTISTSAGTNEPPPKLSILPTASVAPTPTNPALLKEASTRRSTSLQPRPRGFHHTDKTDPSQRKPRKSPALMSSPAINRDWITVVEAATVFLIETRPVEGVSLTW